METSPERPVPVRTVAQLIAQWVGRLGRVWVDGQLTDLSRRPGSNTVFLTLRDPVAQVSLPVTCAKQLVDGIQPPLVDGARVVVHAKPEVYVTRGRLSLAATEIRPVGVGELLARIERLRQMLAAEGLFATERKRRPPFLPRRIGLICGRDSAAERDVLENAKRRWPAVQFRVQQVAVQGTYAATEVTEALRHLDADPEVDVIIVARGGGSLEDLLPFSDEGLLRAVAACRTPVVSAVGHEQDAPLVDLVADVRASTPTDAAKQVVPDVGEQSELIRQLRDRARRHLTSWLGREQAALHALRSRPALADPVRELDRREQEVVDVRDRAHRSLRHQLDRAADDIRHVRARVVALSPAATLQRGYAVVQHADGRVAASAQQVTAGEAVTVRLVDGRFDATVTTVETADEEQERP
ncbi:MAG: exodeoxyribonuclease VII large subunit [Streptosporangiales bacterium]|nr:exodeoxyribonuclease VII large subunit [Streptosporangiales bacterium]